MMYMMFGLSQLSSIQQKLFPPTISHRFPWNSSRLPTERCSSFGNHSQWVFNQSIIYINDIKCQKRAINKAEITTFKYI